MLKIPNYDFEPHTEHQIEKVQSLMKVLKFLKKKANDLNISDDVLGTSVRFPIENSSNKAKICY